MLYITRYRDSRSGTTSVYFLCVNAFLRVLYLHVPAFRFRTCVPLEARAPLGAGYDFVCMFIAGFEERIGARLVPVQVKALDL